MEMIQVQAGNQKSQKRNRGEIEGRMKKLSKERRRE